MRSHKEVTDPDGKPFADLSIDLKAGERNGLIGFRSKRHTPVIDMDKKDSLDVLDYWEPLINTRSHTVWRSA